MSRTLTRLLPVAGAALAILAGSAGTALAGGPGGHGGGHGSPPPPHGGCGQCGGGNRNVNINVNASASASASASARGAINAHLYDMGSVRGGGYGGSVYVGGGYGGEIYEGGVATYGELPLAGGHACAPAPFGYALEGFGRQIRGPVQCGSVGEAAYREDRGGRYGYSERRESAYESRYSSEELYGYEERAYEERDGYGRGDSRHEGGRDCGCDHDRDREPAPYPPASYPDEPTWHAPSPPHRAHPRPVRPRPAPSRQHYSQEPGERG